MISRFLLSLKLPEQFLLLLPDLNCSNNKSQRYEISEPVYYNVKIQLNIL